MNQNSDHSNIFKPHPLLYELPKNDRWIIPGKSYSHHLDIYPNHYAGIRDRQNRNIMVVTMPSFILWNKDKSHLKNDFDAILKAYAGCIYNWTKIGIDQTKLYWKVWNLVQEMNGMP